jgi:hypothetical protein
MAGPSETVCVAAPSPAGAIEAAQRAAPPRELSQLRGVMAARQPVGALPVNALLAYLPPESTSEPFVVRSAGAVDPTDPTRGLVVVEGVTSIGASELPLELTVMLSLAESMGSAPTADFPVLQNAGPGPIRPITRIDLAKGVLDELIHRMPDRTRIAVVAFDRGSGRVVLPMTPASDRERIREVLERMKPVGAEASAAPVDAAYTLATKDNDPCVDHRMLLLTDDRAVLAANPQKAASTVESWGKKGLELWTVSLGLLGRTAPEVEALAVAGRGTHLYADTRSEAVEPLVAALRATGAVVREPAVSVAFGPGVTSWTRVGGTGPGTGAADAFTLPQTLEAAWRELRVYEVTLDPATPGPLATVTWKGGSPIPGEWTVGATSELAATPLSAESSPLLKRRAYALALAEASTAPSPDWAAVRDWGTSLSLGNGPARELLVWADLLSRYPTSP